MGKHAPKLVTIFGGSGFVGRQLVQHLAKKGYRIRVAVRRPDLAGDVRPLGAVGQIHPVQANVRDMPSVERAVAGADIVINLTGILFESGKQKFQAVQTNGAKNVAEAAKAAGASQLVHMSALGADAESESDYARSKALGEQAVLKAFPQAIIIRPSIIFGSEDGFFNMFGALARLSPVLPLVGGNTKMQPIYVGDVADAFDVAAEGGVKGGKIYEIGGPTVETMKELLQRLLREIERKNLLLPIPTPIAKAIGWVMQILPNPMLTVDQVKLLQHDNVVSEEAKKQKRTLKAFGIEPKTMAAIMPTYVWRFMKHGQFDRRTEPLQRD
ncbi:complex I NDUFA9 subunit family protein [Maritalea myrionectae]|mgnify:CR=1 FL=1|uniref:NADH:ubiquinone reductase (H(+)-translocating) n=1 Tax=Maritalea myrionectae TaxID=454601 RepID=A0A2R4MIU4_9HYPH|nr:complex I NDUFA9 subunit family protein [Maritalea myrionectae]AVX05863.1 NADH:ubiquinone reductase (H(+)-translocating) [Maritalea myrionectae]